MIGAIIVALLAGFLGRALMPGRTPGGFFFTLVLGFAGSFLWRDPVGSVRCL